MVSPVSETVLVALISGGASILGAIVGAAITKYGVAFWRAANVINCQGTALEMRKIDQNHSLGKVPDPFSYTLHKCKIVTRGYKCSFDGQLVMKQGEQTIAEGIVTANGRFHNGFAYGVYTVKDQIRKQSWNGVIVLKIPSFGSVTGYWMTEEQTDRGKIAFGNLDLHRT